MFEVWKLKRQIKKIESSWAQESKKLEQKNAPPEEFQQLEFSMLSDVEEVEKKIDWIVGTRLLRRARSLDVDVPPASDTEMWQREEYGRRIWFTTKGRAHVRKLIHEERTRRFEAKSRWIPLLSVILAIIGMITSLVALTVQKKSADAATTAAGTARIGVELARKQQKQLSARLEFKNFKWDSVAGQTVVSFDVFNEGGSEAREIANGGRDDPGGVPPSKNEDLTTPGGPFSGGPTVPAGELVEHVEIRPPKDTNANPRTKSPEWYAFRKYTYVDIFGDIQESCGVIQPHKGRFYLWQCPPRKEQKNAN